MHATVIASNPAAMRRLNATRRLGMNSFASPEAASRRAGALAPWTPEQRAYGANAENVFLNARGTAMKQEPQQGAGQDGGRGRTHLRAKKSIRLIAAGSCQHES
jgi:hypothetical protein